MSKNYNLIGQKFGKLLVIEKTTNPNNKKKRTFWLCQCDCGKQSIVSTSDLISGKTTQCWNCAHIATGKCKRKDLIGQRFGKLVVQKMIYGRTDKNGRQRTYCECLCDCGNIIEKCADGLNPNKLSSCGCARKEIASKLARDVIGQKFGRLTILEEYEDATPRKVKCLCDCGNEIILLKTEVMSLHTQSCGCLRKETTSEGNTKDWTGYVSDYGVKAIRPTYQNDAGQWLWEYECPLCQEYFITLPARVAEGKTTSCGCRKKSSREELIENFLTDNKVNFQAQYSFSDCVNKYPLKFDFVIFKDEIVKYVIEYDGRQHFEPVEFFGGQEGFEETVKRDDIKNNYCKVNNIPLLRLKYDLSDEEIKEKITNIIYP